MHELSIAISILEIAEQEVPADAGRTSSANRERPCEVLESITVRIGRLSGVEPEALQFAWEVAREETRFRSARLDVELVDVRARCRACRSEFGVDGGWGQCALCGPEAPFDIVAGREIEVSKMVLRLPDDADVPPQGVDAGSAERPHVEARNS